MLNGINFDILMITIVNLLVINWIELAATKQRVQLASFCLIRIEKSATSTARLIQRNEPNHKKELIDFCKETLAKFKVPKKIEFCELPKTSTGKIQKFELRKKAKELNWI